MSRRPIWLTVPYRKNVEPPKKREWVDLTDEELREFDIDPVEAKKLIAKLKGKNT